MKILLSIKPEFANKIFSGEKKFEFRKRIFKNPEVKTMVVYSTMPVGKIIGEFSIKKIHQNSPDFIWEKTKSFAGVDKSFFDAYYYGRDLAFAIEVGEAKLYSKPIDPKEKYINFVPPQSFMYWSGSQRLTDNKLSSIALPSPPRKSEKA